MSKCFINDEPFYQCCCNCKFRAGVKTLNKERFASWVCTIPSAIYGHEQFKIGKTPMLFSIKRHQVGCELYTHVWEIGKLDSGNNFVNHKVPVEGGEE